MLTDRQLSFTEAHTTPRTTPDAERAERLRNAILFTARWLRTASASEDLSPAQSSVLATLVRRGPTRPRDLAAAEALNPTMLSRVAAHLETAGLVGRDPDPDDGRACFIHATDAGTALIERLRARRTELIGQRLAELSDEHLAAIMAALPALEALARRDTGTGAR